MVRQLKQLRDWSDSKLKDVWLSVTILFQYFLGCRLPEIGTGQHDIIKRKDVPSSLEEERK